MCAAATLASLPATASTGRQATVRLNVPGLDLNAATIVWEARDQEPSFGEGNTYTFTPAVVGDHWVEAEAQWPDGRRAFAVGDITAVRP